jgi:aryl-alcohol dehydrogenase-like predicted oxidoreductase
VTHPGIEAAGTWTLGDRTVHRIGLGAMRLTSARAVALLRHAVGLGVDHIDTAAFYPADGFEMFDPAATRMANSFIREALFPYAKELVICTKVGPAPDGLARPDELRAQVEENLRGLGVDQLDVVNLRQHGLESIAEHFGALADLRDKGLIRHLGLSNIRPQHLAQAQAIAPVVCVQNRYGVGFGRGAETLQACAEQGIAFVPFFALAGDRREDGGVEPDAAVAAVARRHGATEAQVRIAWTLAQGPHMLAIPGTGDPAHLEENLAAGALQLSAEDHAALTARAA